MGEIDADLRRDEDAVAHLAERLADQLLAVAAAVDVGRVEEVDAEVEGAPERGQRLLVADVAPAHAADGEPAEADFGDHELCAAEASVVHASGQWTVDSGQLVFDAYRSRAAGVQGNADRRRGRGGDGRGRPAGRCRTRASTCCRWRTAGRAQCGRSCAPRAASCGATTVRGPLGEPVEAEWGLLADGTAVIEMAAAAGPRSRRRRDGVIRASRRRTASAS